jgi:DNA-binding transcriptional LysR family regulator
MQGREGPHLLGYFPDGSSRRELNITSNDAVVDIVEQGFDAGMRFGELLRRDMVALPVGAAMRFVTYAAPSYLEASGAPGTPEELLRHPCLQIRFPSGALYRWEYVGAGLPMAIAMRGPLVLDDLPAIVLAAADGAGICCTYKAPPERFHLYYPSGRNMSACLRALVDFLKSA